MEYLEHILSTNCKYVVYKQYENILTNEFLIIVSINLDLFPMFITTAITAMLILQNT